MACSATTAHSVRDSEVEVLRRIASAGLGTGNGCSVCRWKEASEQTNVVSMHSFSRYRGREGVDPHSRPFLSGKLALKRRTL
jgi:hypothetical protein